MCYFHINDLLPESMGILSKNEYESYFKEPGTLKNRCVRYIKSNLGKKGAWDKLEKLILSTDFWSLGAADAVIDWEQAPVVHI